MKQEAIEALVGPIVEDMGYLLWGCEYLSQGKDPLLRIYIDKAEGIGISDCERVNHQIMAVFEVEDPLPGRYRLEISSPGIPRPLFKDWQFRQYQGAEVQLKLYRPLAGTRKYIGRILAVEGSTLVLEIGTETQEFEFSNIVKANLVEE